MAGKFRNDNNTAWVDSTAAVVWGYDPVNGTKTYAKKMEIRKSDNSGWERVWTDCRPHDQGGRDWVGPTFAYNTTVSCGSCTCGTNTRVDTTNNYTKDGCDPYQRTVTGTCTGCGTLSSVYSGTITTTDGATETYQEQCDYDQDVPGYYCPSYAALTRCYPSGTGTKCGCGTYEVLAYSIVYCSSSNTYTRTLANGWNAPGCISLI